MTWLSTAIDIWKLLLAQPAVHEDHLAVYGQAAITTAAKEWSVDIYDPPKSRRLGEVSGARLDRDRRCREWIDSYIRDGLTWTWEPPYAGDGSFEWCGAFAAFCWRVIKPELRKTYFASTYRLDRYARYQSVNGEKNRGSGRLIAELDEHSTSLPWEPRAGDILLIGPAGSGYGKHITLVESYEPERGVFHTIEGNGTGEGPDGKKRQGVVRARRFLGYQMHPENWHARRVIRPSVEDLG